MKTALPYAFAAAVVLAAAFPLVSTIAWARRTRAKTLVVVGVALLALMFVIILNEFWMYELNEKGAPPFGQVYTWSVIASVVGLFTGAIIYGCAVQKYANQQ